MFDMVAMESIEILTERDDPTYYPIEQGGSRFGSINDRLDDNHWVSKRCQLVDVPFPNKN